ncbi:hypothetical protein ACFX2I_028641 [Malus domestica]
MKQRRLASIVETQKQDLCLLPQSEQCKNLSDKELLPGLVRLDDCDVAMTHLGIKLAARHESQGSDPRSRRTAERELKVWERELKVEQGRWKESSGEKEEKKGDERREGDEGLTPARNRAGFWRWRTSVGGLFQLKSQNSQLNNQY